MRPMTEAHLATKRRHIAEVIAIEVELLREEVGRTALGEWVMTVIGQVP